MTQTVFEKMKTAISVLKLDFTTEEFATFVDDQELSEEAIEAVQTVFSYISEKKQQTTVQTLLKLSRLPKKAPKTFENFDFSLLKSRDLDRIRALPSLGTVYSHRNLAFIGPPGTGKRIWRRHLAMRMISEADWNQRFSNKIRNGCAGTRSKRIMGFETAYSLLTASHILIRIQTDVEFSCI